MSDELSASDPLQQAVRALRHPVPMLPGLDRRARVRQQRLRRLRVIASASMALAVVLILITSRRAAGTPVTFALTAPSVRSVSVVGDFDDWQVDQVQLRRTAGGEWQATVNIRPGRYRFAYVVNHEQWRADTRAPSAPDDFGRPTSVLTVTGN